MKKLFFLSFISFLGFGQKQNTTNGLAAEGYDLVSYFEGKPERGLSQFQHKYKGLAYRFSSQQHLSLFVKNPNSYLPQYGGWCAYAMGLDGSKVEINPESFKVKDGKLYLFYKTTLVNTRSKWDKDEVTLKRNADINWSKTSN